MIELVMCPPKYISSNIKNNIWMEEYGENDEINVDVAMKQFIDLYKVVSQFALVWLIPPKEGLQDQVYVANAASILPNLDKTAVISNFRAEGRDGEEIEMENFLKSLGYDCVKCPYFFEGEAELKWLRDNIYIGGYGFRTSKSALEWMEHTFDMKIIKVEETDPYLYHLDCSIFPIDNETVIVSEETINSETVNEIKKYANVVSITKDEAYASLCNSLRVGNTIFCSGAITEDGIDPYYIKMNQKLIDICKERSIQPIFVSLEEFAKSGAALSCCFMHLSYDMTRFNYP